MKRFIVLLLLFFSCCQNLWAIEIDKYVSAIWWNANQSGHGFNVHVTPDNQILLFWYVYHPDGTPMFLLGVGDNDGNVSEGNVFYTSGMKFGEFDPADKTEVTWGTFRITFHSCGSATFEYSSPLQYDGVPYGSGTIQLTRFLPIDELHCQDVPYAGLYQGNFISERDNELIPGVGLLVPNGDMVAVSNEGIGFFGSWSASGQSFSANGFAISLDPNAYGIGNATANGVISPEHRLNVSYSVVGGDYGVADLYATPSLYRRGASLEAIAGTYTGRNLVSGFQGTATVQSNGAISGSDGAGCTYSGQISVPDGRFNLLGFSITVGSCGDVNGNYNGYGMVDDYQYLEDGNRVLLAGTNGTYAAIVELVR